MFLFFLFQASFSAISLKYKGNSVYEQTIHQGEELIFEFETSYGGMTLLNWNGVGLSYTAKNPLTNETITSTIEDSNTQIVGVYFDYWTGFVKMLAQRQTTVSFNAFAFSPGCEKKFLTNTKNSFFTFTPSTYFVSNTLICYYNGNDGMVTYNINYNTMLNNYLTIGNNSTNFVNLSGTGSTSLSYTQPASLEFTSTLVNSDEYVDISMTSTGTTVTYNFTGEVLADGPLFLFGKPVSYVLSGPAIFGIVIGSVAIACLIIWTGWFVHKSWKKKRNMVSNTNHNVNHSSSGSSDSGPRRPHTPTNIQVNVLRGARASDQNNDAPQSQEIDIQPVDYADISPLYNQSNSGYPQTDYIHPGISYPEPSVLIPPPVGGLDAKDNSDEKDTGIAEP